MTVNDLYAHSIKTLPAPDRLRLATMILNDIPAQSVVDYSDEWSDEDMADFTAASWARAGEAAGEDGDA